jgi:hypothetical protein
VRDFDFNTSYAVFEFAYGAVEARYVQVVSKDFRGANTASVCGTLLNAALAAQQDPTPALDCYARGDLDTRGTQLLDVDYKRSLNGRTQLTLHGGVKRFNNFSEADMADWRVGVEHKRWGATWSAEVTGTHTKNRVLYQGIDSNSGETRQLDGTALVLTGAYSF